MRAANLRYHFFSSAIPFPIPPFPHLVSFFLRPLRSVRARDWCACASVRVNGGGGGAETGGEGGWGWGGAYPWAGATCKAAGRRRSPSSSRGARPEPARRPVRVFPAASDLSGGGCRACDQAGSSGCAGARASSCLGQKRRKGAYGRTKRPGGLAPGP